MISRQYSFIFVHVPKTAGNSVKVALHPFCEAVFTPAASPGFANEHSLGDGQCQNFWNHDPEFGNIKHWTVSQYGRALGGEMSRFRIVCCCRNPYDWVLSAYFFLKQAEQRRYFDWIDDPSVTAPREFCEKEFVRFLGSGQPSQASYVRGALSENLLIIRFESLLEDFSRVCSSLSLPALSLPHLNRSFRPKIHGELSPALRRCVRDVYRDDFSFWGYEE